MISDLTTAAAAAGADWAGLTASRRAELLHDCADALDAAADEIFAEVGAETGLPETWLRGELARTVGQLRMFADLVERGDHLPDVVSREVAPGGADVVMTAVPVGIVAVFGASNFPLALGVTGSDTAGALAAGCPVIVKAHPDQPRTSRLLARLLSQVLPESVFTLVEGDNTVAVDLVRDRNVTAVGFTGSRTGGRAIIDAAASRPDPIPVYAEMGSLNPVFVLPGAAADLDWADALVASATTSAGQLCTKPGLVVVPDDAAGSAFATAMAARLAATDIEQPMLTERMATAHAAWLERARELPGVTVTAGRSSGGPVPFAVDTVASSLSDELLTEHFGPTLVIHRAEPAAFTEVADSLEPNLTATLLATEADSEPARVLLAQLTRLAGRVVVNGTPTGVAVCEAMVHGGPWPATSAPWSTSIGAASIARFVRPVALQGTPDWLR